MTAPAVEAPDNVSADPVLDEAQKAVDAHEAGKVTEPVADAKPADAVKADEPVKEPEKKDDRPRENGKFAVDWSKVTLPKDAVIDAEALGRTVAIAREQGLPREQAQAVVDLVNSEVAQHRASLLESHSPGGAEWTKNLDTWKAETLADTTLGKTPEERKAAIDLGGSVLKKFKAANPEMGEAMDKFLIDTGIGERRELAHFLAWLGKSAGERPLVMGSDSSVAGIDPIQRKYIESGMNP